MEQTSRRGPTAKQAIAIGMAVATAVEEALTWEQAQHWTQNKGILKEKVLAILSASDTYSRERADWKGFYRKFFGLGADFTGTRVPTKPEGRWRLILIPAGHESNRMLPAMRTHFSVWAADESLDRAVCYDARSALHGSYAVWVRDGVGPDDEYLGKSTDAADTKANIGVTLLERLLLELKFFYETGQHLDCGSVTLCTGSRVLGGYVPGVGWYPDRRKVGVSWFAVDGAYPAHGLRQAVSL
jgi:hypothetical protein